MGATKNTFPAAATAWLTPDSGPVLAIGVSSAAQARRIAKGRYEQFITDTAPKALRALKIRWPDVKTVAAESEHLPFRPQGFGAVVVDSLPSELSGEQLASFAKALRPGGKLILQRIVRDDTVPWVKRLAAILRQVEPEAMATSDVSSDLVESEHFPILEHRDFRLWIPVQRDGLLAQARALVEDAGDSAVEFVTQNVGELYDSLARRGDPLLLPYAVHGWRAIVDHTRVRADLLFEDSIRITI
ncbi:MAG: hypothetical protein LBR21_04830 [Propionibacteriaceae bacterium]|jgi:SAM-dependent methyltransferase|nr:hypothetical protein [Propionibacteriaceae bacterium]